MKKTSIWCVISSVALLGQWTSIFVYAQNFSESTEVYEDSFPLLLPSQEQIKEAIIRKEGSEKLLGNVLNDMINKNFNHERMPLVLPAMIHLPETLPETGVGL